MADLEAVPFEFVPEEARVGSVQMALEEVAASRVTTGGPGLVRVFRWSPSTLSLGYRQDPATVDWAACEASGVDVTRRQTGGGGIYHDHDDDISYTIVLPRDAVSENLLEAYHRLCQPLLSFFDDLGIEAHYANEKHPSLYEPACFLRDIHPAHDIVVDGRKLSGNAQYRQRDAVIQHGSILFDTDPNAHLEVFLDPGVSPSTYRSRTTTVREHLDIDRATAVAVLEDALVDWAGADRGGWSSAELGRADRLASEKYDAEAWVRRRSPSAE